MVSPAGACGHETGAGETGVGEMAPGLHLHRGPAPSGEPAAHLVLGHRVGPMGAAVLRTGAELAGRLGAGLHVVHAVDLSDYPIDPDSSDWERDALAALAAEQAAVETALAEHPIPWTYHAAHGDPVALLRQVADRYDAPMVVVGSRGEGVATVLGRLLDPSVSHGLITHSHRPVLVVPPAAHTGLHTDPATDPGPA